MDQIELSDPGLRFYRYYADAPAPRRADNSAAGTLPTRAFRYCEAVRIGCGWGYWMFAPLSFQVMWDGHEIAWRTGGSDEWEPLTDSALFPGFPGAWEAARPPGREDAEPPPFLTALPEPGLLQITLGIIPTVNPGWLLYLRPAVNFPGPAHVAGTEGLVDGEAYRFGPLFANVRLTATGRPITFLADRPLVQLTPVPRWLVADELMQGTMGKPLPVTDMAEWAAPEWDAYHQTIVDPNLRPARKHGEYAVRARKAAAGACPYSG